MNETLELGRANGLAPFRSTAERCKEVAWGWSSNIYRVSSTLILFSNIPSFILLLEVNQKNNRKSKCPTSFSTSCRSRVSCDHTHSSYCDVSISLQTSRKQRYASERSFKSSVRLLETLTQPTFSLCTYPCCLIPWYTFLVPGTPIYPSRYCTPFALGGLVHNGYPLFAMA